MANILDYLDWRGDLTLRQDPFNEVDNLLLAELSFVDLKGIVPEASGGSIPLREAAQAFFARFPEGEKIDMGVLVPEAIPKMLRRMAASRRFGDMRLNCFVDKLDVGKAEQFAALTIELGDGTLYLSFRGTDDSLAGWKEDFLLACMPEVPAQKKAVEYVRMVAGRYPRRKLRLGGHSKGGNLAVYGGVFCPASVQRRIVEVYSNDGPGFHSELLSLPEHQRLAERIHSIVPKSSIVGMLLEHEEDYAVVDSDQLGFLQHDGFSWQVMGGRFVKLREMSQQVRVNDQELRQWLRERPVEQREKFVDAMFDVLSASGAVTLSDLRDEKLKAAAAMVRAMQDLDKETREGLLSFMGLLFKGNLRLVAGEIQEETEKKTDQLWENIRQALEETGRKTEEKAEQLKDNIRQALEETEKKTEEAARKIGLKRAEKSEKDGES